MYGHTEKQKFVTTIVNNVGYINKQLAIKHILQFLQANPNFNPRETVRTTQNGSFISFVEATGFIQIDKSLIEMYVGIPIGYPKSCPVFLLAIDRNIFTVNQEQRLLAQNLIAQQKNQSGQDFIRLRFPILQAQWNPKTNTINNTFKSIMLIITRPSIIKPKHQQSSSQNLILSQKKIQNNNNNLKKLNSQLVTETVGKFYGEIAQLLIGKQSLHEQNQAIDYNQCREAFLQEHLPALKQRLQKTKKMIQSSSNNLRNDIQANENSKNCDRFLEISETQKHKLQIISEQQALKQAESKLRTKIENDPKKFSQYKKMMKILYDRMFENQTKLLKAAH